MRGTRSARNGAEIESVRLPIAGDGGVPVTEILTGSQLSEAEVKSIKDVAAEYGGSAVPITRPMIRSSSAEQHRLDPSQALQRNN